MALGSRTDGCRDEPAYAQLRFAEYFQSTSSIQTIQPRENYGAIYVFIVRGVRGRIELLERLAPKTQLAFAAVDALP